MDFQNNLRFDIFECGRLIVDHQWDDHTPFLDPFNRFYYVLNGETEILVEKKRFTLRKGCAYLLPAGTLLHLKHPDTVFEKVYFHFNAFLPTGVDFFSFYEAPLELPGEMVERYLKPGWTNMVPLDPQDEIGKLDREFILRLLIIPFIDKSLKNGAAKAESLERFEKVLTYIHSHYEKNITVNELAKMMFLQTNYFSNLFAKHFGESPTVYLRRVRLEKAQYFLKNTEMTIKSVASSVGYQDEFYFSKIFKKHVGTPPSAYRVRYAIRIEREY